MTSSPIPRARRVLLFYLLVLGVGWPGLPCAAAPAARRPNVILILTDDQGYGDLGCHGNPVLKTPHLDRLHAESIRFTDFHSAPVCTPTRGQLMTGVDALRNGATHTSSDQTLLRREFATLPELFAAGGYRTALFGKWHLGDNYPYRPQDRGFQETIWFPSSTPTAASSHWNSDYFDDVYFHNGARRAFEGYCTDVFFREATAWMRERAGRGEPFFCYLPLNAPHTPLFVPERYREPYRDQHLSVASFFGMIANIDENIGKLETFLRETGLRENTILIFMTDNGGISGTTVFNAGLRGRKGNLYDGGHRIPFFVRWPAGRLRAAGDIDALAQAQDVLPTLIDFCGLKRPETANFDGASLAPLMRGETGTLPDRMLVVQYSKLNPAKIRKGDAAVLWKKWRLVSGSELYDLANDPGQQHNIFEQHPDVIAKMEQHYARWWAGVEARVNEAAPIHIGSDQENPTVLTPCHWHDSLDLDQQSRIRSKRINGAWVLHIERDGNYEFVLRRWPVESGVAIASGMPAYRDFNGALPASEVVWFAASEALPIAKAQLQIAGASQSKPVAKGEQQIVFHVPLKRGRAELKTWFRDADGQEICGAYYVYARRTGVLAEPAFPLKVSDNKRHLVDQQGRPFFVLGDTPWFIQKQKIEDVRMLMDDRIAKGFNTLFLELLDDEHIPPIDAQGNTAFDPETDITKPVEPFWAYAEQVLDEAEKRGLFVIHNSIWFGAGQGLWMRHVTPESCRVYGEFLAKRFARFRNVMWMHVGDRNPDARLAACARELAGAFSRHAPHQLQTAHLQHEFASAAYFNDDAWLDVNLAYTYGAAYLHVLPEYRRSQPVRPVIFGETGYEGEPNQIHRLPDAKQGDLWTPYLIRRNAWWGVLSGATGYCAGTRLWRWEKNWREVVHAESTRQAPYILKSMEAGPWWRLVPDAKHEFVTAGFGEWKQADYATAALADDGSFAVVYVPTARPFTVDLARLSGQSAARWVDPASGEFTLVEGAPFANARRREFTPRERNSAGDGDWVLVFTARTASQRP